MFTKEFIEICKKFTKERKDVLQEKIEDNKKYCYYNIEFFSYNLEFRYIKKEYGFYKTSSLYCVLYLNKNSVAYYHLIDIIPYIKEKTFKPCYFWNIESEERLRNCFESLVSTLDIVIPQLNITAKEGSIFQQELYKDYRKIYKLKDSDLDFDLIDCENDYTHKYFKYLQKNRDGMIFSRFTVFPAYNLLFGQYKIDKAIEKYNKINNKGDLWEYEKQLLNFLKNNDINAEFLFEPDCNTSNLSKTIMNIPAFLKAFLAVFAVASLVFCVFFIGYNFYLAQTTEIYLSAPWHSGFLCAGLCSVFGSIAFFYRMPNKRLTKNEQTNIAKLVVSKAEKRATKIIFGISVLITIVLSILIATSNARFYKDTIKFDKIEKSYNQIHSVYHIDARYNEYGDRINRGSYVILFKDKTSLDLDGLTSEKYTEKQVLPFLKEKGIEVINADSERKLPWYTE